MFKEIRTNKNVQAWLVLLSFLVLIVGFLELANAVFQNDLGEPVSGRELSVILKSHPQVKFKQCIASDLSRRPVLVNLDIYNCELEVIRTKVPR